MITIEIKIIGKEMTNKFLRWFDAVIGTEWDMDDDGDEYSIVLLELNEREEKMVHAKLKELGYYDL